MEASENWERYVIEGDNLTSSELEEVLEGHTLTHLKIDDCSVLHDIHSVAPDLSYLCVKKWSDNITSILGRY